MLGGEQAVKISHLCDSIGNIMHELGHVLNLWHEQSRRDRDEYILINEDNIKDGKKNNFDVLNEYQWEMRAPNVSYDLCSLMHYGPYAFAKDTSKPTIEVLNTTRGPFPCPHPLGQREELSFKDKLKINLLYSCHNETGTHTYTHTHAHTYKVQFFSLPNMDVIGHRNETKTCTMCAMCMHA